MKLYKLILGCGLLALGFTSCNYLDIVPDEVTKIEDTYRNEKVIKDNLYSCYGAIYRRNDFHDGRVEWACGGLEFEFWDPANQNVFYSPSRPARPARSLWPKLLDGIRRCYEFLDIVDKVPSLLEENRNYYKAEAKFLIAYYHFLFLENFGPAPIIDHALDINTPVNELPERSSYDECVEWIDAKLTEVLPELSEQWSGEDYGRITQSAVWAIKSRMHLYAASPLFNGNPMYADFKSKIDGRNLISQEYSSKKWEKSAKVSKEAIDAVAALGHHLYSDAEAGSPNSSKPGLSNKAQRRVRYSIVETIQNPETLLAETRSDIIYDIQMRSIPRWTKGRQPAPANSIGPTVDMVELFYTENGLPIDKDKDYDFDNRFSIVDMPVNYDGNNYSDKSNGKTIKLHLNREPRFYAWVGFQNGFTETAKYDNKLVDNNPAKCAIKLDLTKNGPHGKGVRTRLYSASGYLSKKFVHPANQGKAIRYPFPVYRMAELYLNYAEALIEWGHDLGDDQAKFDEAIAQIDLIRARAGVPSLEEAWTNHAKDEYKNNWKTYENLRDIVRRERTIEFYFEGQHFWDIRRWVEPVKEEMSSEKPFRLLNIEGASLEEFFTVQYSKAPKTFHLGQYFMPIPLKEVNIAQQFVQNPFYE